jgi:geranylgeranyl pyrophosphate synthase
MIDINRYLKEKGRFVNCGLNNYLRPQGEFCRPLLQLMRYSVLGKGKRIRPILVLSVAEMLGKNFRSFLPCACGIEMIHVSSLILDDLPCMDDALIRRRKVALHRITSEANAILASYALLMEGVKLISRNIQDLNIDNSRFTQIMKGITGAVGLGGICLGQFWDLGLTNKKYSCSNIERIHFYKTAALFVSSVEIAAVLAKAEKKEILALKKYGRDLGLAFQIKDDLLGCEKESLSLGKSSLKGEIRPNYARLVGIEQAKRRLNNLVNQAQRKLTTFGKKAELLRSIVRFVEMREK